MDYSRIGIIGDIHAQQTILGGAVEFLEQLPVQVILCTGDVVNGVGDVNACCELLARHRVVTVRGDNDNWFLTNRHRDLPGATLPEELRPPAIQFLHDLPATKEITTTQGPLLLCHGIGPHDMAKVGADDSGYALEVNLELHEVVQAGRFHFMVNGHSHERMVRRFEDLTVINAGTLLPFHKPCVGLLDLMQERVQFFDFVDVHRLVKRETFRFARIRSEPLGRTF